MCNSRNCPDCQEGNAQHLLDTSDKMHIINMLVAPYASSRQTRFSKQFNILRRGNSKSHTTPTIVPQDASKCRCSQNSSDSKEKRNKNSGPLQVLPLPYEMLCTCDVFPCPPTVLRYSGRVYSEPLCSSARCRPHTLWRAASCCLISRPSDTNVHSAHRGVYSQQWERSPRSSFILSPLSSSSFPPSLTVSLHTEISDGNIDILDGLL